MRDGKGVQEWPDGSKYEGVWDGDKANGKARNFSKKPANFIIQNSKTPLSQKRALEALKVPVSKVTGLFHFFAKTKKNQTCQREIH